MASAYERDRDRRIEENHKKLQELGLAKGGSEILGIEQSKKRKRKEDEPLGANWYNIGNVRPTDGIELIHHELAAKLAESFANDRTEFNEEEVDGFRFHNLTVRHYICVGDSFFKCARSSGRNRGECPRYSEKDLPEDDKPKKRERRDRVTKKQPVMTLRRRHQDLDYSERSTSEDHDDFADLATPEDCIPRNATLVAATQKKLPKDYIPASNKGWCENCMRYVSITKNGNIREHGQCGQQKPGVPPA